MNHGSILSMYSCQSSSAITFPMQNSFKAPSGVDIHTYFHTYKQHTKHSNTVLLNTLQVSLGIIQWNQKPSIHCLVEEICFLVCNSIQIIIVFHASTCYPCLCNFICHVEEICSAVCSPAQIIIMYHRHTSCPCSYSFIVTLRKFV